MEAGHDRRVPIRVITWNLFHGRDHPPDPGLLTWRSRLTRRTERGATHAQLNRDLLDEFIAVLARRDWDIALLQECPPRWAKPLTSAFDAQSHRVLTSRNWFLPATQALARWNPDLIASWEGGCNLTLVRSDAITERSALVIRRLPERRLLALTRLESGLVVANLHASGNPALAEEEVRSAASAAKQFARRMPLIFGGDLNLRPSATTLFDELARNGFTPPTAPDAIDHLLASGLSSVGPPFSWPPEDRELQFERLAARLSDHAPVEATFE
jgi:endonuclease/exonuclease/phosphatase family metal-dependent hydrolase